MSHVSCQIETATDLYWREYCEAERVASPASIMKMDEENYGDEEEMNATHRSTNHGIRTERNDLPEIPLCGCLSVRFYQPYFDIDTADVISRISNATFFCKREDNFLSRVKDKPDAYGPFWIATTLIFTLAVTSHINSWLSSWMQGKNWCTILILHELRSTLEC